MGDTPKADAKIQEIQARTEPGSESQGSHRAKVLTPARLLGRQPTRRASVQALGHLEGFTDGSPDGLGVHAVGEGALYCAPAELIEHEVLGHALRVDVAELRIHPIPEFRQPHAAQGTAAAGSEPARRRGRIGAG